MKDNFIAQTFSGKYIIIITESGISFTNNKNEATSINIHIDQDEIEKLDNSKICYKLIKRY